MPRSCRHPVLLRHLQHHGGPPCMQHSRGWGAQPWRAAGMRSSHPQCAAPQLACMGIPANCDAAPNSRTATPAACQCTTIIMPLMNLVQGPMFASITTFPTERGVVNRWVAGCCAERRLVWRSLHRRACPALHWQHHPTEHPLCCVCIRVQGAGQQVLSRAALLPGAPHLRCAAPGHAGPAVW